MISIDFDDSQSEINNKIQENSLKKQSISDDVDAEINKPFQNLPIISQDLWKESDDFISAKPHVKFSKNFSKYLTSEF